MTRAGARAGRGFHYQDVVGAWVCAGLLAGRLAVDRVVPEGFEDLSCEGPDGWHVQVKSRQEQVGDFSANDVAVHLLAMAAQHAKRVAAGVRGRPVLVVERPIDGLSLSAWDVALSAQTEARPITDALLALARRRGEDDEALHEFCRQVTVFVLPWHVAADEARSAVAARFDLLPAAADPIVRALRNEVADTADQNATRVSADRRGIDRTRTESIATALVQMLDMTALEEALTTGACEPVDFDTPLHSSAFYEGVDVQPGHIVAGLPAPRPTLTGEVVAALERRGRAILTGPSGVGKSTVMWAAAYSTRHALWYRVRRLQDNDVQAIANLAKALRPSSRSPVGFIVDGIGVGSAQAWDALVSGFAGVSGVLLLGSARTEDLLALRTLPGLEYFEVALDEEVASHIHAALLDSGATTAPHWREAYDDATGLTLEFTHFLTRGRRLGDVISEQVRRRVDEGREAELRLLALVATAHRWSADLDVRAVQARLGIGDADLRRSLARLGSEHLVEVRGTRLVGLHQLRSIALSEAVHAVPPPALIETVRDILSLLDESLLRPFLVGALRDAPRLAKELLPNLVLEVERRSDPWALAEVLDALRIADFHQTARSWARTLEANAVAPAYRAIAVQLALVGGGSQLALRPEIAAALPGMLAEPLSLRDEFLDGIGDLYLSRQTTTAEFPGAIAVLGPLAGRRLDGDALAEFARRDTALARSLNEASATDLAEVLAVAREVSTELAATMLEAAGGREHVFARLKGSTPGLVDVAERSRNGVQVAYARLLHVSDDADPDPDGSTRTLARTLLRCLPACDSADVQTLLPGDVPLGVGGLIFGVSNLERRYDHSSAAVQWTRVRAQIAASAAGAMDRTARLALAAVLLPETSWFLDDLTRAWCVSKGGADEARTLETRRSSLRERSDLLSVPIDRIEETLRLGALTPSLDNDHLHSLIQGIIDNLTVRLHDPARPWASLAAYTGDTLRDYVSLVREAERWDLIDREPPSELLVIDQQLSDLNAVLAELAWGQLQPPSVETIARSGAYAAALRRVADAARANVGSRSARMLDRLRERAQSLGIDLLIWTRPVEDLKAVYWPRIEVAIGVPVASPEEWIAAADALPDLVKAEYDVRAARPPILITPMADGRPVRQLALSLQTTPLPGQELVDRWSVEIGEPRSTPLTDQVTEAHQALQALSALGVLAARRDLAPELSSYRDDQEARLRQALDKIARMPYDQDAVTAIYASLTGLEARVRAEVGGATSPRDTLAGRVAAGVALGPTPELNELSALLVESLRRDLWQSSA